MNRITITNLSTIQPLAREYMTTTLGGLKIPVVSEAVRYFECVKRFRKAGREEFGRRFCGVLFWDINLGATFPPIAR